MKKFIAFILTAAILLVTIPVNADEVTDVSMLTSALLLEPNSQSVIFESESEVPVDTAGLTRLAALMVICKSVDNGGLSLTDVVNVSDTAAAISGPTAFISSGEKITAESLLKSAVMIMAGDAVFALAEHISGTEAAFASYMNSELKKLKIDLEYKTCLGSDIKLTSKQLGKIGCELVKSRTFLTYSGIYMDSIKHESGLETELVNPNRLVRFTSGCTGLATGSSSTAGYCGIFSVTRGETSYICIVTGAANSAQRFAKAQELIEYGFANYKAKVFAKEGETLVKDCAVSSGKARTVNLVTNGICAALVKSAEDVNIEYVYDELTAPLFKSKAVGVARCKSGDKVICEFSLYPECDVEKATLIDYIKQVFLNWVCKAAK